MASPLTHSSAVSKTSKPLIEVPRGRDDRVADESRRRVSGLLELFGERIDLVGEPTRTEVDHAVPLRRAARQDRGGRRPSPGGRRVSLLEQDATLGQPREVRRRRPLVAVRRSAVRTLGVHDDDDDVGVLLGSRRARDFHAPFEHESGETRLGALEARGRRLGKARPQCDDITGNQRESIRSFPRHRMPHVAHIPLDGRVLRGRARVRGHRASHDSLAIDEDLEVDRQALAAPTPTRQRSGDGQVDARGRMQEDLTVFRKDLDRDLGRGRQHQREPVGRVGHVVDRGRDHIDVRRSALWRGAHAPSRARAAEQIPVHAPEHHRLFGSTAAWERRGPDE